MHGHSKKEVEKILVRIAKLMEVRTSPLRLFSVRLRLFQTLHP
jgi:hypothetical protein